MSQHKARQLLREFIIAELDLKDVKGAKKTPGSTHVLQTYKVGDDKFFLKFSEESLFDEHDPSLQILVEYMAYKIYQLYPGVRTPQVELVYDEDRNRVGLSTSAVKGKMALTSMKASDLGKRMSAGTLVDIFLANWDVVGMEDGNVIVDDKETYRIDPGGALTFRAQGGRKGSKFGNDASELKTMLNPNFGGAGVVLTHADMKTAKREFLSVTWSQIKSTLSTVAKTISNELSKRGMDELNDQWMSDAGEISSKLAKRYVTIQKHVSQIK